MAEQELRARIADLEQQLAKQEEQLKWYRKQFADATDVPNKDLLRLSGLAYDRYQELEGEWNDRIADGRMDLPCPTEFL